MLSDDYMVCQETVLGIISPCFQKLLQCCFILKLKFTWKPEYLVALCHTLLHPQLGVEPAERGAVWYWKQVVWAAQSCFQGDGFHRQIDRQRDRQTDIWTDGHCRMTQQAAPWGDKAEKKTRWSGENFEIAANSDMFLDTKGHWSRQILFWENLSPWSWRVSFYREDKKSYTGRTYPNIKRRGPWTSPHRISHSRFFSFVNFKDNVSN